jgi:nucleoside phosphorylase
VFDFLVNLFQQHTDAWISAIVTVLPTLGVFFGLLYQKTSFRCSRSKELQKVEELKQKIQPVQSKEFTEKIQKAQGFVLNDPRVAQIYVIDYTTAGPDGTYALPVATLKTYTSQDQPEASLSPNNDMLPYLDDPLSVSNVPPELSVVVDVPAQADVLLVTVTEIETKAVLQVFTKKHQHDYKRHFIGSKTYYELDTVNGARIFLVQSEMGVSGPGSSLLTIREGIQALGPSNVIMIGLAFGVDPQEQRIGDVLVSQQLRGYDLQRYGTACDGKPAVISRGDRVTASAKLLDRFRSGSLDWPGRRGRWGKQVFFGTILSGETLVDNVDYRDQLRALEPEAIGGEMEGIGLYAAAQNARVDWIMVKAICDWADGNKSGETTAVSDNGKSRTRNLQEQQQRRAANNAAQFTMHVLEKTRLV